MEQPPGFLSHNPGEVSRLSHPGTFLAGCLLELIRQPTSRRWSREKPTRRDAPPPRSPTSRRPIARGRRHRNRRRYMLVLCAHEQPPGSAGRGRGPVTNPSPTLKCPCKFLKILREIWRGAAYSPSETRNPLSAKRHHGFAPRG